MHAAVFEPGKLLRLKDVVPAIDCRARAERLLRLAGEADAGRTPHVIDRVLITRVILGQALCDCRPDVGKVWQLVLVQLLENAGFDLPFQKIRGRHDNIVAGFAGEKLCLQGIVGIEVVVTHPDSSLFGEISDDAGSDIVGPVVDVHDPGAGWLCGGGRNCEPDGSGRCERSHPFASGDDDDATPSRMWGRRMPCRSSFVHHVSVGSPIAFHAFSPPAR